MATHHRETLALARSNHWEEAHRLIQRHDDALACRIHGYLHRVEGDLSNAAYWYRRADCPQPDGTLEQELDALDLLVDSQV